MPEPIASGRDTLLAAAVDEESNTASNSGHDLSADAGEESSDPVGVQELRRIATESSSYNGHEAIQLAQNTRPASFASSAITLSGFNPVEGFDLDKTLRHIVRR